MLYARAILLRNCGRFTHVSSDFGSQYHTHTFATSEALYASLTRGVTWRHEGRFVDLEEDARRPASDDYFLVDYDVRKRPVWFTPGVFVDEHLHPLPKQRGVVDMNDFNVVDEDYPSTGSGGRAYFCPTYGRVESVLPDHRLFTCAFSPRPTELDRFLPHQTFMMGKKRTMFQVVWLSQTEEGQRQVGACVTPFLQVTVGDVQRFVTCEVLAATLRYLLVCGETRESECYWRFSYGDHPMCLPEWFLRASPLGSLMT